MRPPAKCHALVCVAIATPIGLATGCGGGSSTGTTSATRTSQGTSTATPPATAAPALTPFSSQLLLTVNDLPTGWAIDNSQAGSTNSNSCYSDRLKKVPTTSYAEAYFAYGGNFPELIEQVGTYSSSPQAYESITSILTKCTSFTDTITSKDQVTVFTGTMGAMSFPKIGTQSSADSATLTTGGVSVAQDFVVAEQGDALIIVALGDLGSVSIGQLESLKRLAMTKVTAVQARQ